MKYFAALGIALLVIAAASVGPWAPSPFTSQTGTNTTAAAWRTALGASGTTGGSLTNTAMVGGSETGVTNSDLTASRVVVSSASKVLASSSVTSTTLGYLDATSSVQTQLDSKPTVALTNVARLDQSQTWTGTPTFPGTVFPSNSIGLRLLWSSPTTIYLSSVVTNASNSATNNGDYVNTTHFGYGVIPPLLSSNSMIVVYGSILRTNANASVGSLHFYIGSNTNWVGCSQNFATSVGQTVYNTTSLLSPGGGNTSWLQGANFVAAATILGPTNFFDCTVSNTIYFGMTTATSHTNVQVFGFRLYELYAP